MEVDWGKMWMVDGEGKEDAEAAGEDEDEDVEENADEEEEDDERADPIEETNEGDNCNACKFGEPVSSTAARKLNTVSLEMGDVVTPAWWSTSTTARTNAARAAIVAASMELWRGTRSPGV